MSNVTRPKRVDLLIQENDERFSFRLPTEMKSLIEIAGKRTGLKKGPYVLQAIYDRLVADGYYQPSDK